MPLTTVQNLLRRIDAAADGARVADAVPTGFPSVDRLLGGGVRRGDLIVVGGDTGSGKSALLLGVAVRAAMDGHSTAFLTAEMSAERALERLLAIEGRATVDDIRRGALDEPARSRVGAAALALRDATLDVARLTLPDASGLGGQLAHTRGLELAVVDPVEALAGSAPPRSEGVALALRQLKALAVDLDVALVVAVSLPGLDAGRPDPRPRLGDFAALGAAAQHADVVLGLFREEMYAPTRGTEGAVELHVLKNRGGPLGYVDLYYYKQWMRFEDMVEADR